MDTPKFQPTCLKAASAEAGLANYLLVLPGHLLLSQQSSMSYLNSVPPSQASTAVASSLLPFISTQAPGSKSAPDPEIKNDEEEPQTLGVASYAEEEIVKHGVDNAHGPPSSPKHEAPGRSTNLVSWDGPNDPDNPQNWSVTYKWFITLLCILLSTNV